MSRFSLYRDISELYRNGCIDPSPVLVEAGKAPVAQAEAELLIESDNCRIITRAKV
jgi:methionine aminopeptidase